MAVDTRNMCAKSAFFLNLSTEIAVPHSDLVRILVFANSAIPVSNLSEMIGVHLDTPLRG